VRGDAIIAMFCIPAEEYSTSTKTCEAVAIPFYNTDTTNERIVRIREVNREGRPSRT